VPDTIDNARQLIRSRLADLDVEAESLERALVSLGEGTGAKRRPGRPRKRASVATAPPQPKRARRKGKGKSKGKRAPRGQRREQFLTALAKSPGARVSEIAKQLGISANQTHTLAGRLHQQKAIRKSGKGYRLTPKSST
jgi:hypothetical protein